MASTSMRNPLAAFMLAILVSLGLSAVVGFAGAFILYLEFRLFFVGFALFGAGAVAGRKTYLGSLGFVGSYLGAFPGLYLAEQLFWEPNFPSMELLALGMALAAGLGGFMMGKVGGHHLAREQRVTPGLRRCSRCGARVGLSARKCWSCKAFLTY